MMDRKRLILSEPGRFRLEAPAARVHIELVKHGARGPVFRAMYQGQEIARSVRPFYDSARALRAMGLPYWQDLEMILATGTVSMRAMIGWAADHTTAELAAGGLHRRRWTPYPTPEDADSVPEEKTENPIDS